MVLDVKACSIEMDSTRCLASRLRDRNVLQETTSVHLSGSLRAMSENPESGRTCGGASRNCDLLIDLHERHTQRREEAGITDPDAVVSAMAVGLVIEVWRNSPVEDMHASQRGPSDAAMFAESTALHDKALVALTTANRNEGLIDFEAHLLDRTRPWAGTGGRTLNDLGHGYLGQYRRHVKGRTDALMGLGDHTCVSDPLEGYLINRALTYGRFHKGMPAWRMIVERIGVLLAHPDHAAWPDVSRGAQALAEMPPCVQSVDQLTATLLTNPSALPVETLEWLTDHLLYAAAPPYCLALDDMNHVRNQTGSDQ